MQTVLTFQKRPGVSSTRLNHQFPTPTSIRTSPKARASTNEAHVNDINRWFDSQLQDVSRHLSPVWQSAHMAPTYSAGIASPRSPLPHHSDGFSASPSPGMLAGLAALSMLLASVLFGPFHRFIQSLKLRFSGVTARDASPKVPAFLLERHLVRQKARLRRNSEAAVASGAGSYSTLPQQQGRRKQMSSTTSPHKLRKGRSSLPTKSITSAIKAVPNATRTTSFGSATTTATPPKLSGAEYQTFAKPMNRTSTTRAAPVMPSIRQARKTDIASQSCLTPGQLKALQKKQAEHAAMQKNGDTVEWDTPFEVKLEDTVQPSPGRNPLQGGLTPGQLAALRSKQEAHALSRGNDVKKETSWSGTSRSSQPPAPEQRPILAADGSGMQRPSVQDSVTRSSKAATAREAQKRAMNRALRHKADVSRSQKPMSQPSNAALSPQSSFPKQQVSENLSRSNSGYVSSLQKKQVKRAAKNMPDDTAPPLSPLAKLPNRPALLTISQDLVSGTKALPSTTTKQNAGPSLSGDRPNQPHIDIVTQPSDTHVPAFRTPPVEIHSSIALPGTGPDAMTSVFSDAATLRELIGSPRQDALGSPSKQKHSKQGASEANDVVSSSVKSQVEVPDRPPPPPRVVRRSSMPRPASSATSAATPVSKAAKAFLNGLYGKLPTQSDGVQALSQTGKAPVSSSQTGTGPGLGNDIGKDSQFPEGQPSTGTEVFTPFDEPLEVLSRSLTIGELQERAAREAEL